MLEMVYVRGGWGGGVIERGVGVDFHPRSERCQGRLSSHQMTRWDVVRERNVCLVLVYWSTGEMWYMIGTGKWPTLLCFTLLYLTLP